LDNIFDKKGQESYENLVLVTMHRRENHQEIKKWFEAINNQAVAHPELDFILPIHPNPNVLNHSHLLTHVKIIPPAPHDEMIENLLRCRFAITDSGGLQEEASFLNKKTIICRKTTERQESLGEHGFLCESPECLSEIFERINLHPQINAPCPYGDGKAAAKITQIILQEKNA
jgi:UDP-N-acetylglucosamine 2-epimerase (non-hydrolysing)